MGKFLKKARRMGGVIEVTRQGQLGVRTRARAQAIEKMKAVISSNCKFNSCTSAKSVAPTQISYLELRSRRLAKNVGKSVGCAGDKSLTSRKSSFVDECRKLSDLTNSDILADDTSSRLALSAEDARGRQTNCGGCDENREIICHFYGDNEVEDELLLHGCEKSFQQWGSRGRAPPSVAQSRSNSRSNSVTRELPPPVHEIRSRGILTRNQRKMKKQFCETDTNIKQWADMGMEMDMFCHASEHCPMSGNPNSGHARSVDVEVSFAEKTSDEGCFAKDRLLPEPAVHDTDVVSLNLASPLDMEIENFFQEAEQKQHSRFIKQYNFDPVTDTPLPGRYDWVCL